MALYQPRRAIIAPVLANLMQADFAEGITARARFWKSRWPKNGHALSSVRSNAKNYYWLTIIDVEFEHVQTAR